MNKIHITGINRKINENAPEFVRESERKYSDQIEKAAQALQDSRADKPIILLSGPSGAGKTTSALRIEELLDIAGITTHTVSMDDYFLPATDTPKAYDDDGKVDYESPHRMDIALLNEHMMKIANCEPVEIPEFNFTAQERRSGTILSRKPGELVVFEGIHALNPEVTGISDELANCIYVSVRTRLELSNGQLMHPSYIRLMRRMVRDRFYRARKLEDTMDMFESVERGENLYIMPHRSRAKINIDTFIQYEASAYKQYLYEDVKKIFATDPEHRKYSALEGFLEKLDTIPLDFIPEDSLVREFVGGSRLHY